MHKVRVIPIGLLGRDFIQGGHLPPGKDEYYLRNEQSHRPQDDWRHLRAEEIETLVKNGNTTEDWEEILVTDHFTPHLVKNCEFYGLVRIGRLDEAYLEHHDMRVPVGLTNSRIIACDIGDNAAVHNVRYLAHYIVGHHVILMNLDEMHTTDHAKFGNGIVKDGEDEDVRIWLDLINEAGGRSVMPFDGMTCGDATLWAKHPDDAELLGCLCDITQRQFDPRRGFYGTVGDGSVVKNCRIIKDVKVGPCAYIKGANKLKNCHVFYGCKAVRFVMGDNSSLKYGARLIHSVLGDNSCISCCEVLNDLIFPAHEQHHNNSFLIASLVMGQSNIAACATIGSNHNSRAPDGEIHAGRGFWPGLCVSVKHNCKLASFVLLAKGDYPAEMNVPLPFSLVSNDVANDRLQMMPAYWWLYNMYALARNSWKFQARDKRQRKVQNIEFEALAPDTVEEMFAARDLLAEWTAKAHLRAAGEPVDDRDRDELVALGRELLDGPADAVDALTVVAEGVEAGSREVRILKARAGYHAYRRMILYYGVKSLLAYLDADPAATLESMARDLAGPRQQAWANLGGQLIAEPDLAQLKGDIKAGRYDTWDGIHDAYDRLWERYPRDKQRHGFAALLDLLEAEALTPELWQRALDAGVEIQQYIRDQTYASRKKDFDNPFRRMVYDSDEEMEAVLGLPDEASFVRQVREETAAFIEQVDACRRRTGAGGARTPAEAAARTGPER